MKLLSFNLNSCKAGQLLVDYLIGFDNYEFLLFQGFNSLYLDKFEAIFPDHKLFFSPSFICESKDGNYSLGLLTCTKNSLSLNLLEQNNEFIIGDGVASSFNPNISKTGDIIGDPRNIQQSVFKFGNGRLQILNYHGISQPSDKKDTGDRLDQSKALSHYLYSHECDWGIIAGDLNLDIDTEALAMIESDYLLNLIKEFKIEATRPKGIWPRFSDYIFTTNDLEASVFEAFDTGLSDHFFIETRV